MLRLRVFILRQSGHASCLRPNDVCIEMPISNRLPDIFNPRQRCNGRTVYYTRLPQKVVSVLLEIVAYLLLYISPS